jgi:hypothetical protein
MTDASTVDFDSLASESGGVLAIYVFGRDDLPPLIAASMRGDAFATQLADAVLGSITIIEEAPRRRPMPCGCCLGPVRQGAGYKIGVVLPDATAVTRGMGFALCRLCSSTAATADAAAIRAVQDIYPNAREIVVTHPAGGAA